MTVPGSPIKPTEAPSRDLTGVPTEAEQVMALSKAAALLAEAREHLAVAAVAVAPHSPHNVLDRARNYAYQLAITDARGGIRHALRIVEARLLMLVPRRCDWPGGHIGPFVRVDPFQHVQRCETCGQEWGK